MAHTTENTTGYITLPATAVALSIGVRVKWDGTNVAVAAATDSWIGVTTTAVAASGNAVIKLRGTPGTFMVQSAGAITAGARLYAAASGQVDDAQSAGPFTGLCALRAAGGSGEIIEAVASTDSPAAMVLSFPVTLSSVSAADIVTAWTPSFAGTITALDFIQGVPVTTAAKAASVTSKINSTATTGGVVALTSAACTPLGKLIAGSAITALNSFAVGDTISITASAVTAFVEGTGVFLLTIIRN